MGRYGVILRCVVVCVGGGGSARRAQRAAQHKVAVVKSCIYCIGIKAMLRGHLTLNDVHYIL